MKLYKYLNLHIYTHTCTKPAWLYLWAAPVQSPLRVEVCDGSTRNVNADQGPVDLQVDWDQ